MPNSVPEQFKKLIQYLAATSGEIGSGVHNEGQRPWMDFQELAGEAGNFDFEALRANFDRVAANTHFIQADVKNPKADECDVTVPKLASDFMAACERDFVEMRKRSRIRMIVHSGVFSRINEDATSGQLALDTLHFLNAIEAVRTVKSAASDGDGGLAIG
jgi:hypothetical protein